MQKKTKEDGLLVTAKGVTQEEFIDFMKRAEKVVDDKLARAQDRACWERYLQPVPDARMMPAGRQTARDIGRLRQRFELHRQGPEVWAQEPEWLPIWSFDHPNIHGGETGAPVLEALGLSEAEHFPLTQNSPDLHRVVERTHARLCQRFDRWFLMQKQEHSMSRYKEEFMRMFYEDAPVASAGVIDRDACGETHGSPNLRDLYLNVVSKKGDWADRPFR